jgi:DNA-binding response OmpR family regulator
VLVVDDNADIRSILEAGLRTSGFAVWVLPSGRAGVIEYMQSRELIDVILLDVRMPDWDGPETLAAIRALNSEVPCCFMSGDMGSYSDQDLHDFGAAAVLQKPFRLGELIAQLQKLVRPFRGR